MDKHVLLFVVHMNFHIDFFVFLNKNLCLFYISFLDFYQINFIFFIEQTLFCFFDLLILLLFFE